MRQTIKMSVATVAILSLSACGGSNNGGGTPSSDKTISGRAVDGYLSGAAVCLDLDGNGQCSAKEPNTFTDENGSYEITATVAQQNNPNYKKAKMIVFGGRDIDTGKNFTGKLVSEFNPENPTDIFITPVSTVVASVIKADSNLTKEQAETKVAKILGLTKAEVTADPIAEAKKGNTKVLSKALEIQKAVEVLADSDTKKVPAVYDAFGKTLNKTSEESNVSKILTDLGDDSTQYSSDKIKSAKDMAENTKTVIDTMKGSDATDIKKAALTINDVKNDIDSNKTIDLDSLKVPDDKINQILVKNILSDIIGEKVVSNLTDDQIDSIVTSIGDNSITLKNIASAMKVSSDNTLVELEKRVREEIKKEDTEKEIKSSYIASVTAKDVLTKTGSYSVDVWSSDIDGNKTVHMSKTLVKDGKFVNYDYNKTSDKFEEYTDDNNYDDKTIKLVNGSWQVKSDSESWNKANFNKQGDLIFYDDNTGESRVYSVSASDASGMDIKTVYSLDKWNETDFNTSAKFSKGAMYYEITSNTINGTFKPSYKLWYYQDGYWDSENNKWIATDGGNDNYARYYVSTAFKNFNEFKKLNVEKHQDNWNNTWYEYTTSNGDYKGGNIKIVSDSELQLGSYDTKGSYSIEDINGTSTLIISFDDEETGDICKKAFVENNGSVKDADICYADGKIDSLDINYDNNITYQKEIVITSLKDFISKYTADENSYDSNGGFTTYWTEDAENTNYDAYFTKDNKLEFYTWDENGSYVKTDKVGSYEIKNIDGTEILIIKPPVELEDEWMKDSSYKIYSLQDGAIREGEYRYAKHQDTDICDDGNNSSDEDNQESCEDQPIFYEYNEIAARDMYKAFSNVNGIEGTSKLLRSISKNSKVLKTFKALKDIDIIRKRKLERAYKSREASKKAYRGF